ncbi:TPA: hypothetical protein JBE16_08680 [Legionella pneumophila subsp. pneumophila]|nr:hypothetical protein [Legionella pneumophila]HAT8859270.1 hypothetical protein [Legionella pneumophila subsp. pneumophila]HAT9650884.1 hypothetical protein [Legionella pneumophila subsp. pneumophila]HAT9920276.1 hypothetical protein [Legionella pneumophila subsp. pneumophila]
MISGLILGALFTLFVLLTVYNIIKSKLIDLKKTVQQRIKIYLKCNKWIWIFANTISILGNMISLLTYL